MAKAEIKEILKVSKKALFKAITSYENYPQFVEGCKSVEVTRMAGGQVQVKYRVSIMKEVSYTLALQEDFESGIVSWELIDGDAFKKNSGAWKLKELTANETETTYSIEVEFKVAVPGFILNRLVKGSLPTVMKNFEEQAKRSL